jgi:hypothetical protein
MTGYDDVLDSLGAALGKAVCEPTNVHDAEILLVAIADFAHSTSSSFAPRRTNHLFTRSRAKYRGESGG